MSDSSTPEEIAAQIAKIKAYKQRTPPELREAIKTLAPLIQDLPASELFLFDWRATEAWRNLRRHNAEMFMTYRMAVNRLCGRHVAQLLDDHVGRHRAAGSAGPVVAVEIDELLTKEFKPMEPLLSPWLRKQSLAMVHAERGLGKTHFAMNTAYAVAGGGKFLHWTAPTARKVLYIDGEMPGADVQKRATDILHSTPEGAEPPKGYFRIITPDVQDGPLPDLSTLDGQEAFNGLLLDAELIVVDNLSSLVRSGVENEGESWLPVAEWALARRREGRAVLFVHHDGKNGVQRGTSRREDLLDVVIQLKAMKESLPEYGAQFSVHFKKARSLYGEDLREIEAMLKTAANGAQEWTYRKAEDATFDRVLALHALDMDTVEIATELGVNRSTVTRHLKRARQEGQLSAGGLNG